ncbi:hypothetical protein FB192DRAFT_1339484 [Mucor lusitanicus]|uniref:C2H2-type domain-containing protein n=1 Tax=Mucor circinelloides f. lusitanicus TaxID=29924 RepID=A0A8H4F5Y8_MUCCL|nr:hypothetical protein FB192DRAFT_1339484 [Mucor lusitanicus]
MVSQRKNRPFGTVVKDETKDADAVKSEAVFNEAYTPYMKPFEEPAVCSVKTLKQEDQKPNSLNDALKQADSKDARHERSSSQENTSIDSEEIKQEYLAKTDKLLLSNLGKSTQLWLLEKSLIANIADEYPANQRNKDFYYRCSLCKQMQKSLQAVWEHRESVHLIKKVRNRSIKHLDLEPDVHDPNYYCQTCEKTSTSKANFRLHLRDVHQICLKPLPPAPDTNVEPDPKDVNGYCSACNHTYASRKHYRIHLKAFHRMKLPPSNVRKNANVLPD